QRAIRDKLTPYAVCFVAWDGGFAHRPFFSHLCRAIQNARLCRARASTYGAAYKVDKANREALRALWQPFPSQPPQRSVGARRPGVFREIKADRKGPKGPEGSQPTERRAGV